MTVLGGAFGAVGITVGIPEDLEAEGTTTVALRV